MLGDKLESLISVIQQNPRYWGPGAEVRFGLSTTLDQEREDVGFVIENPQNDPALAVLAIAAIGPAILEKVQEVRAGAGATDREDLPDKGNVIGKILVSEDGIVTALVKIGTDWVELVAPSTTDNK